MVSISTLTCTRRAKLKTDYTYINVDVVCPYLHRTCPPLGPETSLTRILEPDTPREGIVPLGLGVVKGNGRGVNPVRDVTQPDLAVGGAIPEGVMDVRDAHRDTPLGHGSHVDPTRVPEVEAIATRSDPCRHFETLLVRVSAWWGKHM